MNYTSKPSNAKMINKCPLGYDNACSDCPYCKENLCDYPYIGAEKVEELQKAMK